MESRKIAILLIAFASLSILMACITSVYGQENIETFFNSSVPGMKIKVDATPQTQPNNNITFTFKITPESGVQIESVSYNLTLYGFINGTDKVKIYTNTFKSLESTDNVLVPQQVCGIIYGEVTLTYSANATDQFGMTHKYIFKDITLGFSMTRVENVYLKALEDELNNLRQKQEAFSNIQNELNNTRALATVLGVTTVIFLGTTALLILRRPKTYW